MANSQDPRLQLPPFPAQATPGDYIWVDWWRKLQDFMKAAAEPPATEVLPDPGPFIDTGFNAQMYDGTAPPGDEWTRIGLIGSWSVSGNTCSFQFSFPVTKDNEELQSYIETGVADKFLMPPIPDYATFSCSILSDITMIRGKSLRMVLFSGTAGASKDDSPVFITLPLWKGTPLNPISYGADTICVVGGSYVMEAGDGA